MCIMDISLWFPWVPWFPLKLRRDRDHRRLLCHFLLTSALTSLLPFAMPCFSLYKPQQHQSTCANALLATVLCHSMWPQGRAFWGTEPQRIKIKTTQLRLKNMDSQLHSSGFEEFLLCNYFSHRCQCHNKSMNSNKSQHRNTNSFRALKIQVCSKPVLVFKVLPFPE